MPIPNGDLMLCHLMMLHEVRDVVIARAGRFRFELQGRVVGYGETDFCLISGFRFGPYVDVINTKCNKKYVLRNQLFPIVRDEDLRLTSLIGRFLLDQDNVVSPKTFKYMVADFQLPFKEKNIPRVVEAMNFEIQLPSRTHYLNWTLHGVESSPMQQSPPKQRSPSPQPS
uniref:Uncharacterized protein n=1 Tax=Lactuca sativa TaxID=4236 RepID=A0A9R1VTQ0_LACSA|nr:hypothetical protein LSAT_V11C400213580 [Lactuca sativa]